MTNKIMKATIQDAPATAFQPRVFEMTVVKENGEKESTMLFARDLGAAIDEARGIFEEAGNDYDEYQAALEKQLEEYVENAFSCHTCEEWFENAKLGGEKMDEEEGLEVPHCASCF